MTVAAQVFRNSGHCHCCDQAADFVATNEWFRDHYTCSVCDSIPRERALMWSIDRFCPQWREGIVHESSPCARGASLKLKRMAREYIETQYFPDVAQGSYRGDTRCENLELLTFEDNSIDLHVTQDVMEHVFCPERAFAELARTLRPGGMHIFTVPLVNKDRPTEVCARLRRDGSIDHRMEPEYHGNPISDDGALVTTNWGYDICEFIHRTSGLFTQITYVDALDLGIRAEFIEVLVTRKPALMEAA